MSQGNKEVNPQFQNQEQESENEQKRSSADSPEFKPSSPLLTDSTSLNQVESNSSLPNPEGTSSASLPSDFLTSVVPLPQPPENPANTVPPKTLWMGDLEPWWDEGFIKNVWAKLGKHVEVKVIKPKHNLLMHQLAKTNGQGTVNHSGYCFIEFDSPALATEALSLNGTIIPDTNNKSFRLNWAPAATLDSQIALTPEYSLFVGDLSANTTEAHLLALFQSHFNSVKTVRVMTDPSSGLSRCFGFVRFSNEDERQRALVEMNGKWLGGRQIRVALASPKHQNNQSGMRNFRQQQQQEQQNHQQLQQGYSPSVSPQFIRGNLSVPPNNDFNDPTNTTVFVGGLANGLNEDTLLALFEPFGSIVNIKVPPGKGCGFVKFSKRGDAEHAIESMQGFVIGGSRVRLSWGRPSNKNMRRMSQLTLQQQPIHQMYMPNMVDMSNMNNPNIRYGNLTGIPAQDMGFPNIAPPPLHPHSHHHGHPHVPQPIPMPSHHGGELADSKDGNLSNQIPNMTMFSPLPSSTSQGQPMIPAPMYELSPHGNMGAMFPGDQVPQSMGESAMPHGMAGMPTNMPPPFIYDPYLGGMVPQNSETQYHHQPPPPPPASITGGHTTGQYMYVPQQVMMPNHEKVEIVDERNREDSNTNGSTGGD